MLIWAVLTVIVGVGVALLTIPLVRRHDAAADARGGAAATLAAALADIDTQVTGGSLTAVDADALRTEAKRRVLGSARGPERAPRPLGQAALGRLAIGLAAFVAVAATALYATLGRPDLAGETAAPATAAADTPGPNEIATMIAGLEKRMAANPSDPEGWRLLGWSYFQTQRYDDAATAYGKAVALSPKTPGYASAYGEALAQAAQGVVSPAARAQFEAALALDPKDPRARYFLGVAKEQAGQHAAALDDWIALAKDSPPDAPWLPQLRTAIDATAKGAHIDIAGRLPSIAPNPSADQVAAVQAMAPGDQQAMIRGMVDKLAGKLKDNPKDPEGWVRLIRARMVLGDAAAAGQAKRDALAALKGDAAATATVEQGAAAAGVAG